MSLVGGTGVTGTLGRSLLSGTINPSASEGAQGDAYINTSTRTLWGVKSSDNGNWTDEVSLIGVSGARGTTGRTILTGTVDPTSDVGKVGDYFFNSATRKMMGPKMDSQFPWGSPLWLFGQTGVTGATGRNVLHGNGEPAGTTGAIGDFYIDVTGCATYGPKTLAASWPTPPLDLTTFGGRPAVRFYVTGSMTGNVVLNPADYNYRDLFVCIQANGTYRAFFFSGAQNDAGMIGRRILVCLTHDSNDNIYYDIDGPDGNNFQLHAHPEGWKVIEYVCGINSGGSPYWRLVQKLVQ
jgi:hypothetical protein